MISVLTLDAKEKHLLWFNLFSSASFEKMVPVIIVLMKQMVSGTSLTRTPEELPPSVQTADMLVVPDKFVLTCGRLKHFHGLFNIYFRCAWSFVYIPDANSFALLQAVMLATASLV